MNEQAAPPVAAASTRPLRVVFLLPTFDIGGAERAVLRTAAGLDRRRFVPAVVAFQAGSQRLVHELRAVGVPAVHFGVSSRRSPLSLWRLVRWLRAYRCDVLMSYMFHANLASRLVRSVARVPRLVCSERVVQWETPLRIALNRATVRLADAITTNSEAGVAFWADRLRMPPSRIRMIYNGVDTTRFHAVPRAAAGPLVIGNLGRLHEKSGQGGLLDGLQRLIDVPSLPPWRCDIAGDGPEASALRERVRSLGLTSHVRLLGHVDAPERFLQSLDIYVQPSMAEGFPNAVIEAMATGLPVVATAVGGTPEAVDDGVTGWLVPRAGHEQAIATRLARLLREPAERAAMGRAGRVRVEDRFSLGRMVEETERLLEDLTAGSRATAATPRARGYGVSL